MLASFAFNYLFLDLPTHFLYNFGTSEPRPLKWSATLPLVATCERRIHVHKQYCEQAAKPRTIRRERLGRRVVSYLSNSNVA